MKNIVLLTILFFLAVSASYGCTTWLASGSVTVDGRPILHKNRDVNDANQEYHYVDNGGIPFIGQTYANLETGEYWAGLNAAGFAIENSNSYNMSAGPGGNGFGYGADDGWVQALALATCRTVDDFEALLDSLNEEGRTHNSNYGVIDAFGGAAMFETGGYEYYRIDAEDTPDGFIVRSNYSYSGTGLNNRQSNWGPYRHDRAYDLMKEAVDNNELSVEYMFRHIVRDMSIPEYDPYKDGLINNRQLIGNSSHRINRGTTRTVMIAQGVEANANPNDAILWIMSGNPIGSIAVPLWVRACSVPVEVDGEACSELCEIAINRSDYVNLNDGIDTQRLVNSEGTGLWDYMFPIEDQVFAKTRAFASSDRFDYDLLENFQNSIASQVCTLLEEWDPVYDTSERPIRSNREQAEQQPSLTVTSVYQIKELIKPNTIMFDMLGRRISNQAALYLPNGMYYMETDSKINRILVVR
ncbi:C45 family peptidase [bacterium]|nr:C45 family peptidase [bacterium]